VLILRPIADPDFWWHLRTGQLISETGAIPKTDPYSSTVAGKEWIAHEWLSEYGLFLLYQVGGVGLLIFIFSLIITASFLLIYLHSPGKPYAVGFSILLAALASAPTWGVRPQMLSLLMSAVFLFLLENFIEKRRWHWLIPLPFLTMLWVNLHAGYFLAFLMLAFFIFNEALALLRSRVQKHPLVYRNLVTLCIILVLCLLASLCNPNSYRILLYPFETLTSDSMMEFIQEWFSPDFHQTEWIPLALLIILLIAAPLISRRPVPILRVLMVSFFGYSALHSMRNVPFFALTAIPILAEQLSALVQNKEASIRIPRVQRIANTMIVIAATLVVGLRFITVLANQPMAESKSYPKSAVDWIIDHEPEGIIYNTYGWGGYLIWRLYPDYPVYIDGRADVYGNEFIYDYLHIYHGQSGWETALSETGAGIILIEPTSGLANLIRLSPDWAIVYEDPLCILLIKTDHAP
jgi:hypothetical protein